MDAVGSLEITTVVGCNHMCVYCPQKRFLAAYRRRSDVTKMRFDDFKICLQKLPKSLHIHFSGFSEPWMNPYCTDMVLYAFELGFKVAVFTTADKLSLKDIHQIKEMPFHKFLVHLPDDKKYMNLSVNDRYLKTINELIACNIQNLHFMTIGDLHSEIKRIPGIFVRCDPVIDRAGNLKDLPDVMHRNRLSGKIKCMSCGERLNHNVLLPNGDIALCCMDFGLQHIIGNLLKQEYKELFYGFEYEEITEGLTNGSLDILCRYCTNAKQLGLWGYLSRKLNPGNKAEISLASK